MDKLSATIATAFWIAISLLVVLLITVVFSNIRRRILLSRAQAHIRKDAERMHALQADLLETVKYYSENQRQAVNISRFWQGKNVKYPVRTALIKELTDARIVAASPREYSNSTMQVLGSIWENLFCVPPSTLTLSDRDWLLMVHSSMDGTQILIERMIMSVGNDNTFNTVDTGGGDANGVSQSGANSRISFGESSLIAGLSENDLALLLHALQRDAEATHDSTIASKIRSHAELLDQELECPGTPGARMGLLEKITELASNFGGVMKATVKVLEILVPSAS